MIYIKEIILNENTVLLQVDGRIDRNSLNSLKDVCQRYLDKGKKIRLNLSGLSYICKEGRHYLKKTNMISD